MTKHEIQLQEAMFEVITSEASYFNSLQVLIKHFYHSHEFDCGPPSEVTSCESGLSNEELTDLKKTPSLRAKDLSVKGILRPTEKHHLFSNVLLICVASERFLSDLEMRWTEQKPVVREICDLIVKHAASGMFDTYLTYLRNQSYQINALRMLNEREVFREALNRLHSNAAVQKNHLDSFLALPMQRLTRLKLLVEVIQKLQKTLTQDQEMGSTETVSLDSGNFRHCSITALAMENVEIAFRELKRLLSESEYEKKLMDEKARLLALSASLVFPDNVKRITISDKTIVKEGELKSIHGVGKTSTILRKLGRLKSDVYYFILFEDLLMVTKQKKNHKYNVLDYCERAKLYVRESSPEMVSRTTVSRRQNRHHTTSTDAPDYAFLGNTASVVQRSGSCLSSRSRPSENLKTGAYSRSLRRVQGQCLYIFLTASQNGSCCELCLSPKSRSEYEEWYEALSSNRLNEHKI